MALLSADTTIGGKKPLLVNNDSSSLVGGLPVYLLSGDVNLNDLTESGCYILNDIILNESYPSYESYSEMAEFVEIPLKAYVMYVAKNNNSEIFQTLIDFNYDHYDSCNLCYRHCNDGINWNAWSPIWNASNDESDIYNIDVWQNNILGGYGPNAHTLNGLDSEAFIRQFRHTSGTNNVKSFNDLCKQGIYTLDGHGTQDSPRLVGDHEWNSWIVLVFKGKHAVTDTIYQITTECFAHDDNNAKHKWFIRHGIQFPSYSWSEWNELFDVDNLLNNNNSEIITSGVGQIYTWDGIKQGEIFNDYENNKAVSEYSRASGSNTCAGHFAFSFKEHEYTEADYDMTNNIGKYYLNTVEGIVAGLNYTIVLNNNFGYQGVVNSVGEDYIEVTNYLVPNSDSTKTIYYDSSYIIFPDKPAIQGDMLIGYAANSEGYNTNAMGKSSHAEGGSTISSGNYSHAEGKGSKAGGYASHAETSGQALGHGSHAEGGNTKATGAYSHAEGSYTNATGLTSHAEGESCLAAGKGSHAEGIFAKAHGEAQHVQGRYNIEDYNNKYAHIVGNGTSVTGEDGKEIRTLSNAHTLDWEGNAWFAGDVKAGDVSLKELASSSVGRSTESNGEIFNDYENNKSIASYGHAEGYYTQAGTLAFNLKDHQYSDADYTNAEKTTGKYYLNTVEGIAVNMLYTIVLTNNYDYRGKVISVGEDYIEVDNYLLPNGDTGSTIKSSSYILFPENPEIQGDKIIGTSAHAEGCDTHALSKCSHAEGYNTIAAGQYAHAENRGSIAGGYNSHAEGGGKAYGFASHAETEATTLVGAEFAHAEGRGSVAGSQAAHAEGYKTQALNKYSHAEGNSTIAEGNTSHAEGSNTKATAYASHAEGRDTQAVGNQSHVEGTGSNTTINGQHGHAEGYYTSVDALGAHAEGSYTVASGKYSHAEGSGTKAQGIYSHAEGTGSIAEGSASHVEGLSTTASAYASHAEGYSTHAKGDYSHVEGIGSNTTINGQYGHAEGFHTSVDALGAHAEGSRTKAYGEHSHAEGRDTYAKGEASHAEGRHTEAFGAYSHAEGNNTTASGDNSHAEGYYTYASGDNSHAEGNGTCAFSAYQHVQGRYNIEDSQNKYAHIVGNGTYGNNRSNAHTLDWDGNAWFAGDVVAGEVSLQALQARIDELENQLDTALDTIIAIQNKLMGVSE